MLPHTAGKCPKRTMSIEDYQSILGIDVTAHSGEVSETDTGADQLPGQMSIEDYQIGQAAEPERGISNEQAAAEKEE